MTSDPNVSNPRPPMEDGGYEQPYDAANQSLADALRASFRILKGIMLVLVVLYLFSNVRSVANHEEALVLRLGRRLPEVHDAGLILSLPFPIDEIVTLPTRKSNDLNVTTQSFHHRPDEAGKPLSFIHRSANEGLHPVLDGALLTADSGIVHVQWKVTYKIDNVVNFLDFLAADAPRDESSAPTAAGLLRLDGADRLLRTLVETAGIHVALEMTAEEVIRTRVDRVREELRHRVNERLTSLQCGLVVTQVEVYEPTPPLQIRDTFDDTQRAENVKQRRIRSAEQERVNILSEAAGAAYSRLVPILESIDRGRSATPVVPKELSQQLDEVLLQEAEGKAGKILKDAGAYYAVAVGRMRSDLELYRALLPEYVRNPALLKRRLWEQTRQDIFDSPGVTKIYRSPSFMQFRVKVPLDPEQTRQDEEHRLRKKEFDPKSLRPDPLGAFGPDYN